MERYILGIINVSQLSPTGAQYWLSILGDAKYITFSVKASGTPPPSAVKLV